MGFIYIIKFDFSDKAFRCSMYSVCFTYDFVLVPHAWAATTITARAWWSWGRMYVDSCAGVEHVHIRVERFHGIAKCHISIWMGQSHRHCTAKKYNCATSTRRNGNVLYVNMRSLYLACLLIGLYSMGCVCENMLSNISCGFGASFDPILK